jgi:hypothetical protein
MSEDYACQRFEHLIRGKFAGTAAYDQLVCGQGCAVVFGHHLRYDDEFPMRPGKPVKLAGWHAGIHRFRLV